MILHIILFIAIVFLLVTLSVPFLLKTALKKQFSTVQMTLFSPFSMRGIMISGKTSSWGLQRLTIYISSVELSFSVKKFKLSLNLNNFQIFCTRKLASLVPVNLIDGCQEPNILFNFFNYINFDGFEENQAKKRSERTSSSTNTNKNTLQFFSEGIVHLLLLLMMHVVEVNLIDFKVFVVSDHPEELISFEDNQKRKNSLMLMQCLAEYSISCDVISVKSKVQNPESYQLCLSCSKIICNSYLHWKNTFFSVKDVGLEITIPFSMSIDKSYQHMNYKIIIKEGNLNLIPSDFDHFFQLVKELVFNPYKQAKSSSSNDSTEGNFGIFIDLVKINLEDVYEADYDNLEAKEYLSNVNSTNVTLEGISKDNNCFSVKMSKLSLTKYFQELSLSHEIQVLTIPSLAIFSVPGSGLTEISHDDITLHCQSEEIALFGKIFSLINSRIRFQNYNEEIYNDLIEKYVPGSTIISEMQRILNPKEIDQEEMFQIGERKRSKVIYTPKKIDIQIQMVKLHHFITIEGFIYTREYGYNEMSHQIFIEKFTVEYQDIKQFIVTDFRLTFSLTTNQDHLMMMIEDITMNQDEETLIDYLDSFTLFKHLLQFQSDQEGKITKYARKNVSVFKITLNFGKETVSLKSLEINKESYIKQILNNIYFSLQNSSILMTRLKPEKPYMKHYINRDTTIASFSSMSIKQSLELRNGKPKKKINFVLNELCITLPEVDITSRILAYVGMFSKMNNHVQAYLRNVSNQKLKYMKYCLKEFLDEPPILNLILTKIKLSMTDNKLNNKILGFSKSIREELSYMKKYNQAQVLNNLRRNNKETFLLLSTAIEKIRISLNPIKELEPFEKSILSWMSQFPQTGRPKVELEHRIKQVYAGNLEIKLKKIQVKIRDYPISILKMSRISFQGNLMKIKRIFGDRENFVNGLFNLEDIELNVGLGQLSGFKEIGKRLNQYNVVQKKTKTKITSLKETKTFLHNIFQQWNWKVTFSKDKKSVINILTGSTPYEKEKFELEICSFKAESQYKSTIFNLNGLQLKFKDIEIVVMPKFQLKVVVFLNKGEFAFDLIVDVSEETELQMSCQLMKYIQQLGQLRKDWLLIYGIYEQTIKKKEFEMEQIENMSYAQIANLLITRTANHQGKNSLLNLINQIKIIGSFNTIKISLVEEDLQLSVIAVKASCFLMLKPNHDLYNRFEVIRSNISAEKLAAIFKKLQIMGDTIIHSRVATEMIEHFNKKNGIIYPILTCQNLNINFNWYFVEEWITGRSNICISIDQVSGEISKKIQRYFLTIFSAVENSRLSVQHQVVARKLKPLSKFRNAVLEVIQINRRNKIKKGHVKKFKVVLDIHSYNLVLKHYQREMILSSKQKASFYQSIQYSDNDMYHALPEEQTMLFFPECLISINNKSENIQFSDIMKIGSLKIELHKAAPHQKSDFINWGNCELSDIKIILNSESKNFLNEFINFIVDILNTSEQKRRVYREEMEKYSELINKKPEKLKEKILWSQSDLKDEEKEIFRWNFVFRNLEASLENGGGTFLTAFIDSTKISMNIFSNTRVDRKIIMKKFSVKNLLEEGESSYRNIISIGDQGASLTIFMQTYDVAAFSDVLWKFFKELSIEIEPIKVRMTEEVLNCINAFFEKQEEEDEPFQNELEQYRDKTPDYIKLMTFEPVGFQLWFKSANVFKRMEGIKVNLERYQLKDKLYTRAEIRRVWIIWLLKQLASQALWVLQQKIFGEGDKNQN